ncbi:MAG: hypothetical protein WC013_14745, partial [Aeromonas bestiarum]
GRTAMWATIFDDRIRACVASGCMNTFRERSLKLAACGVQYPYGLLRLGDVPELFSLIAPRPLQLQAVASEPLKKAPGRLDFQRGILRLGPDGLEVRSTGSQDSAVFSSLSQANCYIVLERERGKVAAGETVTVEPFGGLLL